MADTIISMRPPPNIDVTKQPLAYGERCLPKLNDELYSEEVITRQRALMSLCDLMHDPQHITKAVKCGIVVSLGQLLVDTDETVRVKSSEAICILLGHAIGRDALISSDLMPSIAALYDDTVVAARRNAHHATELCCQSPPGPDYVIGCNLVERLVEKLRIDEDVIKEYILDSLHFCMQSNTQHALACNAMQHFTNLLQHDNDAIRRKSARNIMDLSFPLDGKKAACQCGAVVRLVDLLIDNSAAVRAAASGALMSITVTTEGKFAAIEARAIDPLVKLLGDQSSEVRLNALKAITMVTEAPKGRAALRSHLDKVEQLKHDRDSNAVRKAATIAVNSITWKP